MEESLPPGLFGITLVYVLETFHEINDWNLGLLLVRDHARLGVEFQVEFYSKEIIS